MSLYSEQLIDLAVAAARQGAFAQATELLQLALGRSGRDAFVLYGLGHMATRQGRHDAALCWLTQSLEIDPGNAKAHVDQGLALYGLGRDQAGFSAMQRGLEMDADLAMAVMTEGMELLRAGQFLEGWRKFDARLIAAPGILPRREFAQPRWLGDENIAGRTILLHSEQGHGDAIQFARYAPMVAARGATVLVEGHRGLIPLYRGVTSITGAFVLNEALPHFDLHCPLLSLPLAFRTELATIPAPIPYLVAAEDRLAIWRRRLGQRDAMRIGIAWSGNPAYKADEARSIPLEVLEPLLADQRFDFHILQTEIRDTDRLVLLRLPHIRDHTDFLADFAETAALIAGLDLVVTVDTSVAHLAGALGARTWLLLPAVPDWRWMAEQDDTPWYPTMRLFRQHIPGDWVDVIARVRARLASTKLV